MAVVAPMPRASVSDRRGGEARRPPQAPQRIPDVLEKGFHAGGDAPAGEKFREIPGFRPGPAGAPRSEPSAARRKRCVVSVRTRRKPGLLVDRPGRVELGVRPEHDLRVAGRAGERDALLDEAAADAESAGRGLDEQEPQLGDARGGRTSMIEPTISPSSSATQQRSRFGSCEEKVRGDARDEAFELFAPAVLPTRRARRGDARSSRARRHGLRAGRAGRARRPPRRLVRASEGRSMLFMAATSRRRSPTRARRAWRTPPRSRRGRRERMSSGPSP